MAKPRKRSGSAGDPADHLYEVDPDEFVAERDAVVKELRKGGERERADAVKKLRRPSPAAWAINQAVRADPRAAKRLLDAGDRLASAQEAVVAGAAAGKLREAIDDQHAAVDELINAVERALAKRGGASAVDRARETLRAAATDQELRAELEAGRVTREREAIGLGGLTAAPARPSARRKKPSAKQRKGASAEQRKRAEQAERRAARSLDAAVKRERDAAAKLERAQAALATAQEGRERAERERQELEGELGDARAALERLAED